MTLKQEIFYDGRNFFNGKKNVKNIFYLEKKTKTRRQDQR